MSQIIPTAPTPASSRWPMPRTYVLPVVRPLPRRPTAIGPDDIW